jgi:uridine phosphorylase
LLAVSMAVRGEGTSRYYEPPEEPAAFDPLLTARLAERAGSSGVPAHVGVVFTTDAGYRQGPEIYDDGAGIVLGVDSECAAAAVVGASLGLSMGALLFCTDNARLPRTADQKYGGLRDGRVRRAFEAGLDAVLESLAT